MRKLITIVLFIACSMPCQAQSGVLMDRFYITGSLVLGRDDRSHADTSAWLQLGRDTTRRGFLLPKVLLDSISTTKRGLYVYDLKDSVLYHLDGAKRIRYMTYKDTTLVKQLIAQSVPANIITGAGAAPYLPKFGTAGTLQNSAVTDNGATVTVNGENLAVSRTSGQNIMTVTNTGNSSEININAPDANYKALSWFSNGVRKWDMTTQISTHNLFMFGYNVGQYVLTVFPDNNIVIGGNQINNGYKVDIQGSMRTQGAITTAQPSANGAGEIKIGKTLTGTDNNKYLEISVDGINYYTRILSSLP